jgi:hypothetical protein
VLQFVNMYSLLANFYKINFFKLHIIKYISPTSKLIIIKI